MATGLPLNGDESTSPPHQRRQPEHCREYPLIPQLRFCDLWVTVARSLVTATMFSRGAASNRISGVSLSHHLHGLRDFPQVIFAAANRDSEGVEYVVGWLPSS